MQQSHTATKIAFVCCLLVIGCILIQIFLAASVLLYESPPRGNRSDAEVWEQELRGFGLFVLEVIAFLGLLLILAVAAPLGLALSLWGRRKSPTGFAKFVLVFASFEVVALVAVIVSIGVWWYLYMMFMQQAV